MVVVSLHWRCHRSDQEQRVGQISTKINNNGSLIIKKGGDSDSQGYSPALKEVKEECVPKVAYSVCNQFALQRWLGSRIVKI